MTREECCGTCKWHRKDDDGDWYCANYDSEYYTDWTEYTDVCTEHERREK